MLSKVKPVWIVATFMLLCALLAIFWVHLHRQRDRFPRIDDADASSWREFGGDWHLLDGTYTNRADGRGDKLVAGPVEEKNYSVSSDLRFDTPPEDSTFGDAGLLLRVLDPAIGVDALRGYYAGLRLDDHMLLIGTMSFGFRELATAPFPHELRTGHWYRLTFSSKACTFHARAEDTETKESVELSYVEQACDPVNGQVGLRSYYVKASWRDLKVDPLP